MSSHFLFEHWHLSLSVFDAETVVNVVEAKVVGLYIIVSVYVFSHQ
ncbi:MAG: hypothetical protein IJ894_04215 [Bacteroidales bacterium]|nr:hypothetical protein [Bacteroidales bacterium]MBR3713073.1 hypothetical protein [Bacteroidales bacterium]